MPNFDEIVMVSEDDEQNEDMNEMMKFVRARTNRWVECHSVFTNLGSELFAFKIQESIQILIILRNLGESQKSAKFLVLFF